MEGLLLLLLLLLLVVVVVEPGEEELVEGGLRLHLQLQLLREQLLQDCGVLLQPLDLQFKATGVLSQSCEIASSHLVGRAAAHLSHTCFPLCSAAWT